MRTRYIAVKAAIRYKKDGNLMKSVFFDANNLGFFAVKVVFEKLNHIKGK
jgi:hypothetical protein